MEIRVKRAPTVVNRNSAQNPKRWAAILWASSCSKKEEVKTTAKLTRTIGNARETGTYMPINRDKPTPITKRAPMARCLSSVRLNQKTPAGRVLRGPMGSTYLLRLGAGLSTMIGRGSFRGIFALQYSGHAWFSGSRCSTQKYPWQKGHLKGRKVSFPQCWHFTFLWLPGAGLRFH